MKGNRFFSPRCCREARDKHRREMAAQREEVARLQDTAAQLRAEYDALARASKAEWAEQAAARQAAHADQLAKYEHVLADARQQLSEARSAAAEAQARIVVLNC